MTIENLAGNKNLLFECRSGSHAYGLATESSDEDLRGVFLLPYEQFLGLEYIPQLADATNDRTYYELGRFLELLGKSNPTALEMLATGKEDVRYRHPIFSELRVEEFLTKACRDTFAGYALTQIRKAKGLNKKVHNPLPDKRKEVEEFCYVMKGGRSYPVREWAADRSLPLDELALAGIDHARDLYAVYHDGGAGWAKGISKGEQSNTVTLTDVPKGTPLLTYLSFNKDGYSAYCRDYRQYQEWKAKRNEERYLGTLQHGQGYDAKNMMHTIRLLEMATEIFTDGQLRVRRPNREFFLSIRTGIFTLDEILAIAEERIDRLDAAVERSDLPEGLPVDFVNEKLIKLRSELYA